MLIDALAQRYGQRPSTLLMGEWAAFDIDVTVSLLASEHTPNASTPAKPAKLPTTPATYADPLALGYPVQARPAGAPIWDD